MKNFFMALLGGIIGALLVLIFTGISKRPPSAETLPAKTSVSSVAPELGPGFARDVPDAVDKIFPSVVYIDTKTFTEVQDPMTSIFGIPGRRSQIVPQQGRGSGVVIDKSGLILTNEHVVHGANEIMVTFSDNKSYPAVVQGYDSISDLALLKVDVPNLVAARLGDSDKMRIGESVIAVGSPYHFQQTVTYGVLSGRGRNLSDQSKDFQDLLQTDAAINPGNSGGPLVNMSGEVIGINTAIIPYAQGIGFAIPINTVKNIVEQLTANGKVVRPYIGIVMQDLNEQIASYLHYSGKEGIVVAGVMPDGPAIFSGLKPRDIITHVNGSPVKTSDELRSIIKKSKVDDKINLKVWRNGSEGAVTVKVGSRN